MRVEAQLVVVDEGWGWDGGEEKAKMAFPRRRHLRCRMSVVFVRELVVGMEG